MPETWATKRPEQLTPEDFIHLTQDLFGRAPVPDIRQSTTTDYSAMKRVDYASVGVWRKALHKQLGGGSGGNSSNSDIDDDDNINVVNDDEDLQ